MARLHESAINNYTAALLSGATISESKPGEGTKADVNAAAVHQGRLEEPHGRKGGGSVRRRVRALVAHLPPDRPITVAFADGKVALTLHITKLNSGDDTFDHWDVTATYTPELADGGVTLTRDGELTVLPTGFDPAKGGLGSRDVAVRSNLTKVLTERSDQGRGIPQTIKVERSSRRTSSPTSARCR